MPYQDISELQSRLRWLTAIRVLVVFCLALPYFVIYSGEPVGVADESSSLIIRLFGNAIIQLMIGGASIQTLVYVGLLHVLRHRPQVHAYIQFSGDLLLVTLMVYRLGATAQGVSILYLVVICVASVLLRRAAGMVIAMAAFICYAAVITAPTWEKVRELQDRSRWLKPEEELRLEGNQRTYNLLVHLLGFQALALMTSYLARDVTRAEERLRARNLDLAALQVVHRDVIQSISSGLLITDLRGIVTSLNRSGERILGLTAEELIDCPVTVSKLIDSEQWDEATKAITVDSAFSGDGTFRREIELRRDEDTLYLDFTLSRLRDGEGRHRGYILLLQDLSERRHLQEQLRLKDRLAAIGEMAAGLAHEVGNPLAAISGSVQVLTRTMPTDAGQRKLLEITFKESQRLDRTVKSFLQLARSPENRIVEFDIAALLAGDIELLRNSGDLRSPETAEGGETRDGHRIVADLDPHSVIMRGDPDQVSQIFWNLTRNALQAMPEGGELKVTGRLDNGSYVMQFRDTGSGMSPEEKVHLFDPFKSFFDHGTGIGMAIVYRIVEEHGGEIEVDSHPGKGTAIRVKLPLERSETMDDRGSEEGAEVR